MRAASLTALSLVFVTATFGLAGPARADALSGTIAYVDSSTTALDYRQSLVEEDLATGTTATWDAGTASDYHVRGLSTSPNGTYLAYISGPGDSGTLKVRDLQTGTTNVVAGVLTTNPRWASDGSLYASAFAGSKPFVVKLDPTGAVGPTAVAGGDSIWLEQVSPDGTQLLGEDYTTSAGTYSLVDLTSGLHRPLSSAVRHLDGTDEYLQAYNDCCGYISSAADGLGRQPVDLGLPHGNPEDGDLAGDLVVLTSRDTSVSPSQEDLYVAHADGSGATRVTNTPDISEGSPVWLTPRTAPLTPAAPMLGTVTAVGGAHVGTLSWPEPDAATLGTRIWWKKGTVAASSASDADLVDEAAAVTSRSASLTPGLWSWSVTPFDGFGQVAVPQTGRVTVAPAVPVAPTRVTAAVADANSEALRVSWAASKANAAGPVTSYTITRSPGGTTAVKNVNATTLSIAYSTLVPGQKYTFTVRAHNADGLSPASAPSNAVAVRPRVSVYSTGVYTINEGGTAVITGRLLRFGSRKPVAGQKLTLRSEVDYTVARSGVTLTTDKNGYVRLRVKPGTTTGYDWRFTSTSTYVNYFRNTDDIYSAVTVRTGIKATMSNAGYNVRKGSRQSISGTTSSSQTGRTAVVERLVGGGWHTVGTVRIGSRGTFKLLLPPAQPYTDYYRVHIAANSRHPFSSSNIMKMEVES